MSKEQKPPKENGLNVEQTVKAIREKFGEESIMRMDEQPHVDIDVISTGSVGLDIALGIGGLPRGRMIEIFGPESSGKTTLALHVIAQSQKEGGACAFIDAEHAMDPEYAIQLGVDMKKIHISQPDNGEQALEIVEQLVRSSAFDVIVVDSVAALTPKDEIEGDMGQQHVGRQARLMSQAMRKLTAIIAKSNCVVIFINQVRQSIGMAFPGAPTEFTPGGKALKFYTSVRLDIRRIAQIKVSEVITGNRIRVKVVKNKVAPPFRQTEFDLIFGEGISREGEVLMLGEKAGIIKKAGTAFLYKGDKIGRGYESGRKFLKENPEVMSRIIADLKIDEKVGEVPDLGDSDKEESTPE